MKVIITGLVLMALSGFSYSQALSKEEREAINKEVEMAAKNAPDLFVEIDIKSDNKPLPTLTGYTNLPDGYMLAISVLTYDNPPKGIYGKQGIVVKNGMFSFGPISYNGGRYLHKEKYRVRIGSWGNGEDYPIEARKKIGILNERLQGPNVDYFKDTDVLWKYVSYEGSITVK